MIRFASNDILPFTYSVEVTLAASVGATGVGNISMATDSHFEFWTLAASSSLDIDTDIMPGNFTMQMTDNSTGRQMSDRVLSQRILTSPANPFLRMMRPIIWPPNATIKFDVVNTVASANTVTIAMIGYKVFRLNVL